MQDTTENGRSMIEMLGVLTIIGVLSVGGLNVFNRMQYEHNVNQIVNDLSETIAKVQKIATQYDDGYSNVGVFAYKNNAYATGVTYSTGGVFNSKNGAVYTFSGNDIRNFDIIVSHLDEDVCIKLATTGFNNIKSVAVNGTSVGAKNVTLSTAADKCNKKTANTVSFTIKGY